MRNAESPPLGSLQRHDAAVFASVANRHVLVTISVAKVEPPIDHRPANCCAATRRVTPQVSDLTPSER